VALGLAASAVSAHAQDASSRALSFDVASVKENTSGDARGGMISGPTPGRFTITNVPLRFILLDAFALRDHQLVGDPDWGRAVAYDIAATYPEGLTPTEQNVRVMLQRLLADRFGLRVHRERREVPAYDLVLARGDGTPGPQLVRSNVDCKQWLQEKRPQIGAGGPSPVAPGGKRPACMMMATRTFLSAGTQTIAQLGSVLQSMVRRPIVDRTGLAGKFDMDLKWAADVAGGASPDASSNDASIFTAVQEQLGLKLEPSRTPADVVVVDALQRATPD
jgi:uncharacterized protein (TIGR03435 family)